MIVIELTWENEILRVLSRGKEIDYSVEYIPCPTCENTECSEGHHDMCEGVE